MKKIYASFLLAMAAAGGAQADQLTLFGDATGTSTYLPINVYYCSNNIHTQMIYPAESLEAMQGKVVDKITFTITSPGAQQWNCNGLTVKMGISDDAGYSATSPAYVASGLSTVAELTAFSIANTVATPYLWEIALSQPFVYTGGNLVIDLTNTKGNGPRNWTFAGAAQTAVTGLSMTSSARAEKFLPRITFDYSSPASASATLSTSEIAFPLDFVGNSAQASFTLTNTGTENLSGSITVDNNAFTVSPATIENAQPGEILDFTVSFDAAVAGDFAASLSVNLEGIDPLTVALKGVAVDGPEGIRIIFDGDNYTQAVPAGWATYAEEILTATGEYSDGSTLYDDFGSTLRFESSELAGRNAIMWSHANPMAFSDLYTRAYYLVSPKAGGEFTLGGILSDDPLTGAFIDAYEATYDEDDMLFTLGNKLDLTWTAPLSQSAWSTATGNVAPSRYIALQLKYAALSFFAADTQTNGIESVEVENGCNTGAFDGTSVYYNLQGQPIQGVPAVAGLYLVRRGAKVEKIIL